MMPGGRRGSRAGRHIEAPCASGGFRRLRVAEASERIGVQLGVGKTVRHMYRAEYIGYVDDVEILFWAGLARKLDRAVVRLGGEGRLAAVEAMETGAPPPGRRGASMQLPSSRS